MELCVQTGGIDDRFSIMETFQIIKEAGFDSVDYNIDHILYPKDIREGNHSSYVDRGVEGVMEFIRPVLEAKKATGLKINQMHAPFPANGKDQDYVFKALQLCFKAAKALDCHYMVIHEYTPNFIDFVDKQKVFDWNIDFYTALIPFARENDVIICLENLFSTYSHLGVSKVYPGECSDMTEAKKYIETLNGIAGEQRFGFCLDIGHANLCGKRIYDCFMGIAPYLKVLHVHDNNGIKDQHLFPYNGTVVWDDFIMGMKDSGFNGALSFETFNQVMNCDLELVRDEMKLLGAIGRLFVKKIVG